MITIGRPFGASVYPGCTISALHYFRVASFVLCCLPAWADQAVGCAAQMSHVERAPWRCIICFIRGDCPFCCATIAPPLVVASTPLGQEQAAKISLNYRFGLSVFWRHNVVRHCDTVGRLYRVSSSSWSIVSQNSEWRPEFNREVDCNVSFLILQQFYLGNLASVRIDPVQRHSVYLRHLCRF